MRCTVWEKWSAYIPVQYIPGSRRGRENTRMSAVFPGKQQITRPRLGRACVYYRIHVITPILLKCAADRQIPQVPVSRTLTNLSGVGARVRARVVGVRHGRSVLRTVQSWVNFPSVKTQTDSYGPVLALVFLSANSFQCSTSAVFFRYTHTPGFCLEIHVIFTRIVPWYEVWSRFKRTMVT